MNKSKKRIIVLFAGIFLIILFALYFFKNGNRVNFEKFSIPKFSKIDTIEIVKDRGIFVVGVSVPRLLDNFDYYTAIIKSTIGKKDVIYKVDNKKSGVRISKDYFAIVSIPKSNWGWFYIKEGKIENKLPNIGALKDSLKKQFPENYFIQESDGYIRIYLDGKVIQSFNYGNFVTKFKKLNFDSLDYKGYQLQGDSLIAPFDNPDKIFNQKNGIYFIPLPGYGVIKKCRKSDFFKLIDSVSTLEDPPNKISVNVFE